VTIGGAGAYLVVIGGAVCEAEGRGGVGAITWVDPGESVRATAGEEGCRLALLQFPVGATAPG
jgi:hypothetical protein